MEISVVEVTPLYAEELLKKNISNRSLMKGRVQVFEDELRRGSLMLTHQGIAISKSGRLLDGQHRLHAIVNTGIPAMMTVATEVPDETFKVLDTGAKRSAGDVLQISGAHHKDALAAGIRLYLCYMNAPHATWVPRTVSTHAATVQVSAEYESDKEAWQHAAAVAQNLALRRIIVPGPMACLMYLATVHSGFSREYVEAFASKLRQGENLQAGDPILAYRNRGLLSNGSSYGQHRLADYIKLFNACATGQQLKMFKTQQFPPMPTLVDASECIHHGAAA